MAYDLFNNISEIKDFVGGGANISLHIDSIGPSINPTAKRHLIRWISESQYNALVTAVDETPTSEETALLPYVQRPLALLTMYEYSNIGGIQIQESGFHRIETEHEKTAFKYQENNYKSYMLETGYEAIEDMLKFLEANEADYPLWQASTSYNRNKTLFVNYASEFRDLYAQYISRYTFEMIRPLIEDVERFAFIPLLGETEFNNLKTAILGKSLSAVQQSLVNLIQRAVANFAIEEGLKRQWVQIKNGNVVQTESLEPQSTRKESSAAMNALNVAVNNSELWANRHIAQIINFLSNNIDDFPDYKAHLDAQTEAEEEEETDECLDRLVCGCDEFCSCGKKDKKKGVQRL